MVFCSSFSFWFFLSISSVRSGWYMNNIDIDVICWGYFLSFIFCSKDFVFLPDLNCVFFLEKYTIGEDFM